MLTLKDVARILSADVLWGEDLLDRQVAQAFGGDLMSDALALVKPGVMLLTGLTSAQAIRTAEMVEAVGVVFVRGKRPSSGERTIELARQAGIPVLVTELLLYDACGVLYEAGLRGSGAPRRRSPA